MLVIELCEQSLSIMALFWNLSLHFARCIIPFIFLYGKETRKQLNPCILRNQFFYNNFSQWLDFNNLICYFLIHRTNNRFLYTNFNSILNFFFHFEIGRWKKRRFFDNIDHKTILDRPERCKNSTIKNDNYRLIRIYQFSSGRGYLKIT